jgi:tRNA 2-selenouridine synthase
MTLPSESSKAPHAHDAFTAIESLAGLYHPHAIEVQDFAHYALMLDVRSRGEYEDDHIPGAVRLDPAEWVARSLTTGSGAIPTPPLEAREPSRDDLPPALAAAVAGVKVNQAILVYCGQGGMISNPVAQALRWHGWSADVLPGGWINYRRWVRAGLEVLPRLVQFRVIACTLGSETARVLRALGSAGHQVLDLEGLAAARRFDLSRSVTTSGPVQPAQARFESLLLRSLRGFDPALPVWIGDVGASLGAIDLPGALLDALAIAPVAALEADAAARARAWVQDEPQCADRKKLIEAVARHADTESFAHVERWRASNQTSSEPTEKLLSGLLEDVLDASHRQQRKDRSARQHVLPPLRTTSLSPAALTRAVRRWMPLPRTRTT